ncbi:hypothetical protein DSO57_1006771 [Entomophthora muscae]|uniref:Uncharacterized protein n=1 Tax=Entomophthora muscae TaxID=34485 RepID=A0ACC2S9D9_9FUNG|nr:hypothetical protein DSO57_1006771 [Entomophthora muscae]
MANCQEPASHLPSLAAHPPPATHPLTQPASARDHCQPATQPAPASQQQAACLPQQNCSPMLDGKIAKTGNQKRQ